MPRERRILICRLSAIGDCVLTMPMLCSLRRNFPEAHIAWAVEPAAGSILKHHRCLDELISVPRGFLKSPSKLAKLRRTLLDRDFDITIDPQGLFKSSLIAWLSGARTRIGHCQPLARECSHWLNNRQVSVDSPHVVDRQRELLRALDATLLETEFQFPHEPEAETAMDQYLASQPTGRFVVVNPGAGWDSRLWPCERYSHVTKEMGKLGVRSIVVWAGERERAWAEQIASASDGHAVVAPRTSLNELAALSRRASMFLGSDTGPLHIAVAVGLPCVALLGTTQPEISGPYGSQNIVIQEWYQAGTSRERRKADNDAMRAITVDRVAEACRQVLGRQVLPASG